MKSNCIEKDELRSRMREWRDHQLSEEEYRRKSRALCDVLIDEGLIQSDDVLLGYAPIRHEVDLLPLYRELPESVRLALPRVEGPDLGLYGVLDRSGLIRSLAENRVGESFEHGDHDILEPDPQRSTKVSVDELDSLLVPGLLFDAVGRRIGYGSGYYDRLLSDLPDSARRIGVCFARQVSQNGLPEEPHDQRVDFVVTEEGIQ